jgi:hypothetical protein
LATLTAVLDTLTEVLATLTEVLATLTEALATKTEVLATLTEVLATLTEVFGTLTEVLATLTEVLATLTEVLTTLTEVFPSFFLSCKVNARVKPQRRGTARTLPNFCVFLCVFGVLLCTVCFVKFSVLFFVYMYTEQLPPGGYSIAVKYIIS